MPHVGCSHGRPGSIYFALLVGRKLLTKDERRAVQEQLRIDVDEQRLVPVSLDVEQVFTEAAELSHVHTARFLTA